MKKKIKVTSSQPSSVENIILLDRELLRKIFSYLNFVEYNSIQIICKKWHHFVEKEKNLFESIDLSAFPKKIPLSIIIKTILACPNLKKLIISEHYRDTEYSSMLVGINLGLIELEIRNTLLDFGSILKTQNFAEGLQTLILTDKKGRKKNLEEKEVDSFSKKLENLVELRVYSLPITASIFAKFADNCRHLVQITLISCYNLTNELFKIIAFRCRTLRILEIGGGPTKYNSHFTLDGFQQLQFSRLLLEKIHIQYCVHVGDQTISLLCNIFKETLTELHVIRNCFETKISKITDNAFISIAKCYKLQKLSIVYSRKLKDSFPTHIAHKLINLKSLSLRECTTQEDLSCWAEGLPNLEEFDLSGDSWVHPITLHSIAKHPKLKVLKIGHIDHGDADCDKTMTNYPPSGLFLESLFKNPANFPKLQILYLEQYCSLTYWVDIRLAKLRSKLFIRYTPHEKILPDENVPSLLQKETQKYINMCQLIIFNLANQYKKLIAALLKKNNFLIISSYYIFLDYLK